MALSLFEAAKLHNNDTFRQGVIETLGLEGSIMGAIPFLNIQGGAYKYNTESVLPGVSYRGFNEAYDESTGQISQETENLYVFGGNIDVDRAIVKTNGEEVRDVQEDQQLKAMALSFNRTFIKGDNDQNPRELNGLQKRIVGNQLIPAGATSGGDALSLNVLDEAIDAVDNPTNLAMNKAMRRRLTAAARNPDIGGYITYDKDEFGRKVMMYADLPILIVDQDENGDQVLPFTEANPGGGAAASTSIYVMSIGDGALTGIQNGDVEATDLGLLDTGDKFRTNVEHLHGIALMKPKCAARIHGIKNAAIVA